MSVIASVLPILRGEMSKMKIPHSRDKIYKDECVYSFDSPFSDSGLFVNTNTFNGVGKKHLLHDARVTGCRVYLLQKWQQIPIPADTTTVKDAPAPTKLAIGVAGGFMTSAKYELVKENFLAVLRSEDDLVFIPLPTEELPEFVSNVLQAIIDHDGMKRNMQVNSWDADQEKIISKYADSIVQINPENRKIPQDPKLWKDEASDATDNLWLNLSTGYIGGGRKNWDGSGGSGSALTHYIDTGRRFPLVVKLGTITAHGADVWSYAEDEDCLVIDPNLADHLSFWGIDAMKMEKTDRTMGELEVDLNMSYDWSKLMEGQEELEPLSGPGFVGLRNIGSSCYMNSALQCLLSIPEIQQRYYQQYPMIVQATPRNPATDIAMQFSKLSHAVLSDAYVPPPLPATATLQEEKVTMSLDEMSGDTSMLEKYVIAPTMFKYAVAREHSVFSGGKQQDVTEYLTFLLDTLTRDERTSLARFDNTSNKLTSSLFEFYLEYKSKMMGDMNQVKISTPGPDSLRNMWSLPVPLDRAVRIEKDTSPVDQEAKRLRMESGVGNDSENMLIPFEACVEAFASPETVDLEHPQLHQRVPFLRTMRFRTFPRYLLVKLERYYVGENWVQKKISAAVPMPMHLDLSTLRGEGILPGELEIAEPVAGSSSAATAREEVVPDAGLVAQLMSMGFSENGSKRAAVATNNADAEMAIGWVFEHMGDPDFNDPLPAPGAAAATGGGSSAMDVDSGAVEMLQSMGFTAEQCTAALMATDNNPERAADWLFSHDVGLDAAVAQVLGGAAESTAGGGSAIAGLELETGEGKYTLMAVISHMGKNAEHGHYICHAYRNGVWALFNDEKVGKSEKPPLSHGFVYLYRRDDGPGTL